MFRNSLPVGLHEIELIKRARKRRDWERKIPPGVGEKAENARHDVIEAIEIDQWAFREQVTRFLNNLNLYLSTIQYFD